MPKGMYIAVSGGEGTGKTSLLLKLQADFPGAIFTKEPGGTPVGDELRAILLLGRCVPRPWTELHLLMAARGELYARVVWPALRSGQWVFTDRCWVESLVYQVMVGLGSDWVPWFFEMIRGEECPWPDLWILLDVDPAIGLARCLARGELSAFDRRAMTFHQQVRAAMLKVSHQVPEMRSVCIDASQSQELVYRDALTAIRQLREDERRRVVIPNDEVS
jgi:dTMP kinase